MTITGDLDRAHARLRQHAAQRTGSAGNTENRRAAEYLTVLEVAQLARCGHKVVRRAIASGQLLAFAPARKLLVHDRDARAWIGAHPATVASSQAAPEPSRSRSSRRGQISDRTGSVAVLRDIEQRAGNP